MTRAVMSSCPGCTPWQRGGAAGVEPGRDRPDRAARRYAAAPDPHRPARCRAMRRPCGRLGPLPRPAGRGCSRARPGPGPLARPRWQKITASALDIAPLEPWPACRGSGCGAWPTTLRSPLPTSAPGGALMFGQFAKEWPQSAGFRPRIRSGKNVPNGETGEGELTRRKTSFSLGTLDAKLGPLSGAWSGGTRRAHVGGRTGGGTGRAAPASASGYRSNVVSSAPSSATNTASSRAGSVALAFSLTEWAAPGGSSQLSPAYPEATDLRSRVDECC